MKRDAAIIVQINTLLMMTGRTPMLKRWLAKRRLARMVAIRRKSFETQDYTRRRLAMLKHTRGLA